MQLTPEGRVDLEVDLPVSQPTMCAFGGARLETVLVTTASKGLGLEVRRVEPLAGGLFAFDAPVRGLPVHRCGGGAD